MKTGIESVYYRINDSGRIDYRNIKEHGFDCVDYGELCDIKGKAYCIDDEKFREMMHGEKERADAAGIEIYQVHAPWPVDDTTEAKRKENIKYMKRAILGTSLLGGTYFVVHPVMPFGWGADSDPEFTTHINQEFFVELTEYARPLGVVICLENMPFKAYQLSYMKEAAAFVEELNIDNLKLCLDTGHANICEEPTGEMVRVCGKNLGALHIHDNREYADEHAYPYSGTIDWTDFKKALKDIGFQGCLSLECHCLKGCPEDIREDLMKILCRIAKSLSEEA